jgi:hypothetical protein
LNYWKWSNRSLFNQIYNHFVFASIVAFAEYSKSKFSTLRDSLSFDFTFCFSDLHAFAIFQSESEFTSVNGTILANFSAYSLWKAIDKPPFIDISMSTVDASNVLEHSAEPMEALGVDQNLSLVDVILLFANVHQFQFKTVWSMDLWALT